MWPPVTRCSSCQTSRVSTSTNASWWRASAEVMAYDSSNRLDGRVGRSVHGHHVARPDELVQLDVVHVPGGTQLRRVQHHEDVVGVGVHPRYPVAFDAVADRPGMEAEDLGEDRHGLLVTGR